MKPLGFIIITYNRPNEMLDLVKNICQLDKAEQLLEEIIVLNNASTCDYSEVSGCISVQQLPFQYIESDVNLGVSKGRNLAIKKSKAPILILLDDDAILQNKDALLKIEAAFKKPKINGREIAVVSFKVLYFSTLQLQENAFPHKKIKKYLGKEEFATNYFAGGAHAIRRKVIESLGYYPEDFFYGMEEYDLSYRIINSGYAIVYDSRIIMLHKESPLGRKPPEEKLRMMWVNKTKVSFKYLPKLYGITTMVLWSLYYLVGSNLNMVGFYKGYNDIISFYRKPFGRNVLNQDGMKYLIQTEARLWY